MENNNQLARPDNTKLIETITTLNISEGDKQELIKKLATNEIGFAEFAKHKLAESAIAQNDIGNFLSELDMLKKTGMYATAALESKTGSGKITMQFRGGDTKLILPVLIILGVVLIAALVIVFWN